MKTLYRLLCTAALLGSGASLSFATDPAAPAPATGKVLVIDDRHTMEGDIEHIADQYRIRHGGGETWLPADKALRLCAGYEEALAYLRTQANLDDPDEHVRLALWCRDHKLNAEALAEVRRAAELAAQDAKLRGKGVEAPPREEAIKKLLVRLETDQRSTPKPAPAAVEPTAPPLAVDLTAESMGRFISQVQPILMNSCASCHANSKLSSSFHLMHTADLGSRKATQQNLAAVLAQVNLNQPQASPFLSKALGVHGDMLQAPFKNREAAAFRTLDMWVLNTISANPRLREVMPSSPLPSPLPLPGSPVAFGEERPRQLAVVGATGVRQGVTRRGTGPEIELSPADADLLNRTGPGNSGFAASLPPGGPPTQAEQPAPSLPDAYDPKTFNDANHTQPPITAPPAQPAPQQSAQPAPQQSAPLTPIRPNGR